jgi:anti-sigma factor RsiW
LPKLVVLQKHFRVQQVAQQSIAPHCVPQFFLQLHLLFRKSRRRKTCSRPALQRRLPAQNDALLVAVGAIARVGGGPRLARAVPLAVGALIVISRATLGTLVVPAPAAPVDPVDQKSGLAAEFDPVSNLRPEALA